MLIITHMHIRNMIIPIVAMIILLVLTIILLMLTITPLVLTIIPIVKLQWYQRQPGPTHFPQKMIRQQHYHKHSHQIVSVLSKILDVSAGRSTQSSFGT